jgi:HSP20 family protein
MTEPSTEAKGPPAATTGSHSFRSPFRDEFDAVLDRLARGFGPMPFQDLATWFGRAPAGPPAPSADVVETERSYEIKVDLPGFDEKNVEVLLSGDSLTLKAEKSEEREDKQANYHLSERRRGACRRVFRLPDGIDREKITAAFDKGVLVVTVPKTQATVAQSRQIAINK